MTSRITLAAALATGYVLGRTKRGRTALAVGGGLVVAKRLDLGPRRLLLLAAGPLAANRRIAEAGARVRGNVVEMKDSAARVLVTRRMEALANGLRARTDAVNQRIDGLGEGLRKATPELPGAVRDTAGDAKDTAEGAKDTAKGAARATAGRAAPAKKTAAKRTPAKKAPAKKTATERKSASAGKKAPAKKTTTARKSAAKRTGAGSGAARRSADDRGDDA
ncbi:DNA primase [Streptomyces sp. RFCAC02]|uniref:DNA primase n=1 Tax=Streptomyces sp. RFCAC02 TaxID=2499143 RepID=UPI0019D29F87|nr:DNA primase [Streptomyces sp. RFCAC02]